MEKGIKGRKPLSIPLKIISDTLRDTKGIQATADKLSCSRGYIYQELKAAGTNPREFIKNGN